jgi:hypothetical protein
LQSLFQLKNLVMTRFQTFIAFILIIGFASCKSAAYFESPNNLRNISSTLYLTNGKTYSGKLVVNKDAFLGNAVQLYQEGDKQPMRFNLTEVEGYETRGEYYAMKQIRSGLTLGRNYSFMKRLTKDNSRIHLYENLEVSTTTDRYGASSKRYETQYYLQLPGDESSAVWALSSTKFVPNFDEKMSKLIADCPTLANKIANKEQGYYYAQVSLFKEKRAEVLFTIINEYNKCNAAKDNLNPMMKN